MLVKGASASCGHVALSNSDRGRGKMTAQSMRSVQHVSWPAMDSDHLVGWHNCPRTPALQNWSHQQPDVMIVGECGRRTWSISHGGCTHQACDAMEMNRHGTYKGQAESFSSSPQSVIFALLYYGNPFCASEARSRRQRGRTCARIGGPSSQWAVRAKPAVKDAAASRGSGSRSWSSKERGQVGTLCNRINKCELRR